MMLLHSCYGGEDETASVNIQQVEAIEGISEGTYTLYQGDVLSLSPTLKLSEGADEKRYEYRWVVGKNQVIGTEKNLQWAVSLPNGYSMASDIPGVFVAKDKENGLEFRQTFTFQVLSTYTPSSIIVYEKQDGSTEWMSLQGEERGFSKLYPGMIERINPLEPIRGKFTGALYSLNEVAIFTDDDATFGKCISMRNADADEGFFFNVGEYTGDVKGKMYKGNAQKLSVSNVVFGYGASKYMICNDVLHVFNGLDRKLPIFDENTFVKSRGVRQAMSSKQFQRYKKCTFVLHDDNTVGCYHVYNDVMERINIDGKPFELDSLCGCFSEATGMGSNQAYNIYLIGKRNGEYNIYQFYVNYVKTTVQPITLKRIMPLDADFAKQVKYWWGAFGECYAFYCVGNDVYRFDYYEMKTFNAEKARKVISIEDGEEILNVYPQIPGLGLRDEDDCLVMLTYNKAANTSSIRVFDSVSGKQLAIYKDAVPGKALYYTRCM